MQATRGGDANSSLAASIAGMLHSAPNRFQNVSCANHVASSAFMYAMWSLAMRIWWSAVCAQISGARGAVRQYIPKHRVYPFCSLNSHAMGSLIMGTLVWFGSVFADLRGARHALSSGSSDSDAGPRRSNASMRDCSSTCVTRR
jgi:hypothetical protein